MALLTVQTLSESGLNTTYAAATSGGDTMTFDSSMKSFLHVKNGDASSKTVTIAAVTSTTTKSGFGTVTKADIIVAIPAGEERMIGPIYDAFKSTANIVSITYSAVTSVTVALVKI